MEAKLIWGITSVVSSFLAYFYRYITVRLLPAGSSSTFSEASFLTFG